MFQTTEGISIFYEKKSWEVAWAVCITIMVHHLYMRSRTPEEKRGARVGRKLKSYYANKFQFIYVEDTITRRQ